MPIPADTGGSGQPGRVTVTREFRDMLGRPQHGWAKISSDTWGIASASVLEGVLTVSLLPGAYTLRLALWDADNQLTRTTLVLDVPGTSMPKQEEAQ